MSSDDGLVLALVRRYLGLCFRRPYALLVTAALLFVVAAAMSTRLGFRSSFMELLPDESPEVMDLRFVGQKAGGDGYLIIAVDARKLDDAKAFAGRLAPRIEALGYTDEHGVRRPLLKYVEYHYDVQWFEDRALLLIAPERLREVTRMAKSRIDYEKVKATGLLVDLDEPPPGFDAIEAKLREGAAEGGLKSYPEWLIGGDGKYLYVFAKPNGVAGDLRFCHGLVDQVSAEAAVVAKDFPSMAPVKLAGMAVVRIEEDRTLWSDIRWASLLSSGLAILVILTATRFRPVAVVLVMVPMMLGVAVTFGIAWVTVHYVSIVTGFLVAVLIGLGIEYGIHLSMRYWEERAHLEAQAAMFEAVKGTLGGAVTSAATNALAFLVLVFAKFQAFRQFGFIAGLGIVLTLVAAYLVCPPVLAAAERLRPFRRRDAHSGLYEEHPSLPPPEARRPLVPTPALAALLTAMLALGVYSAFAFRPRFDSDLRNLSRSEALDFDSYVAASLGVDTVPAMAWAKDPEAARKVKAIAAEVIERQGQASLIETIASINDLVPVDQSAKMEEIAKLKALLDRMPASLLEGADAKQVQRAKALVQVRPYTVDEVPLSVSRRFTALDGDGTFVLLFPKPFALFDSANLGVWGETLQEIVDRSKAAGVETHILHESRIAARIFALVLGDGPLIFFGAALVILGVLLVDLRSLWRALVVLGPLALGFTWLFAAMRWFDVSLNVLSVAVVPNLVAIAVDNAVHIYHRYLEEGPGSMRHVLRHTGLAAVVATFANGSGYGALIVAHHHGLKSVAALAILGVTCTSIGTTIFFPAFLELLERLGKWRAARAARVA